MTRAAKQKSTHQATVDHGASHPLLEALRTGSIRIEEQKTHLSSAHDVVQQLRVQQPNEDLTSEMDRYERSFDYAVRAWRSATEIYADIFHSLANATASSQPMRRSRADFVKTARIASKAKSAANKLVLYEGFKKTATKTEAAEEKEGNREVDTSEASSFSESEGSEEEREESLNPTSTNSIPLHLRGKVSLPNKRKRTGDRQGLERLSDKIKYDSKGRKTFWDKGAEKPNIPYGALGASEKKAWKAERERQRREKKRAKRAANLAQGVADRVKANASAEDMSKPLFERDYISLNDLSWPESVRTSKFTNNIVPKVEYEDVSAEVDARLKAKEEKKAAAKKEKKRKRVSGDSVEAGELENKPQKPQKKRVKGEEGSEVVGVGANKHEREDLDPIEGEARKKRKKSKG